MALQGDDDNWSPPSESDMKILRARQERQDKVSRLMGDYLLKGYRMLGESCDTCGTILLQDRQKKLLCISCQELDSDTEKDNPALNPQAALSQVREHQLSLQDDPDPDVSSCALPRSNTDPVHANAMGSDAVCSAEAVLLEKIGWASNQLKETSSVEYSSQLCALIGSCAQSLRFLKDLRH
ncbi:PREDICTED: Sjoegren syndrome/scleroderma autoantigen 1 [Nanorana parkeri]|uniref:Sjoegren syndrome/scleroderma autoantigen 1 n=1 Tax=Nanorana parkeri TaxID=125878 RepID=UPI0008541194|nr:PREDICTED: Sjoegren syndrome/scleroderma autoantigen 1 [Nanorana parkeri]